MPVRPLMDKAREKTKVDSVHSGINLPKGYSGKNTLVGIIDGGFDYTHPNFYNSDFSRYRILRVWEQNYNIGNNPANFNYGSEFKTKTDILTKKTDNETLSHGSHVAGIALGNGYGTSNKFKGIANDADIILVSATSEKKLIDASLDPFFSYNYNWSSYCADGISYIDNLSKNLKKSTSINLSLGVNFGPKDGTSSFDRFCNNIQRNGLVLVGSAGNERAKSMSITSLLTNQDTQLITSVNISDSTVKFKNQFGASIDIWGEKYKKLGSRLLYFDNKKGEFIYGSPMYETDNAQVALWKLSAKAKDTCFFWVVSEINSINNKPHLSFFVNNLTVKNDSGLFYTFFDVHGKNTKVNLSCGIGFKKNIGFNCLRFLNYYPLFQNGNSKSSIGEIGGTGKNIITVGSYVSKNNLYLSNLNLSYSTGWYVNELSLFSSLGPTYDNRMKPDISAPGEYIESSFNSFDNSEKTYQFTTKSLSYQSKNYHYGALAGTSMAAPMVTGIIALWMEAYPELNVNQVKLILQSTAIRDFYVKDQPNSQNYWGYGKIDAYWGMKYLLSQIPSKPKLSNQKVFQLCSGDSIKLSAPFGYRYLWNDSQIVRERIIKKPGKYSVRVINENEFLSQWSDTVTVINMPKANVPNINPAVDLNICEGENAFLKTDSIRYKYYYWSDGSSDSILKIKNSGYYNLQVGNSLKCMSNASKTIKVVVYPKPTQPNISYQFPNLISSQTDNNQWYLEGVKIENATGQSYEPFQSGNYTVEVSNKPYNCKNYSNVYYHQNSSKSKYNLENNLVFPNPFTDKIQIRNLEMIQKIEIYNMLAQKVKEVNPYKNGSQNIELNLENIPPGSYHLKIVNGVDKTYNQIIIKK